MEATISYKRSPSPILLLLLLSAAITVALSVAKMEHSASRHSAQSSADARACHERFGARIVLYDPIAKNFTKICHNPEDGTVGIVVKYIDGVEKELTAYMKSKSGSELVYKVYGAREFWLFVRDQVGNRNLVANISGRTLAQIYDKGWLDIYDKLTYYMVKP